MHRMEARSWAARGAAAVSLTALALASWSACKTEPSAAKPGAAVETATAPVRPAAGTQPAPAAREASIVKEAHGAVDGQAVERYTLTNRAGLVLKVITYGAIITELHVPDREGKLADVVLGFDRLDDYVAHSPYFGATIGRVANRIANATFELGGKPYALAANSGPHHLHGGKKGWDKVVWRAEPVESADGVALRLSYVSPDGEEGYPGQVVATTVYTLGDDDVLKVEMSATSDAPTLVNMAHHTYWNLAGHASGSVGEHVLRLFAAQYTPAEGLIPDGRIAPVAGTPLDFTQPQSIGKGLAALGAAAGGFDHNFIVDGASHRLRPVARLHDPSSGRTLTLEADQPGVQFYSGNFLDGKTPGKGGAVYARHAGLCLESQKFPNSIHVPEWKDEVILNPGQTYRHTMVHRFTLE